MTVTAAPAAVAVRPRLSLAELASRGSAAASPALSRVLPDAASASRVVRASFQSFAR